MHHYLIIPHFQGHRRKIIRRNFTKTDRSFEPFACFPLVPRGFVDLDNFIKVKGRVTKENFSLNYIFLETVP